jgi:branched-chain amino acid transport system ATP-binding protein
MPEVALRAEGLDKRFGGLRAVAGVSLDVHVGEIHAVIGPNGAGKTTLVNLLSGDLHASAGAVFIGDAAVTALSPDRRALAGLGRSYQKTTIFARSTALENVRLAVQARSPGALSLVPRRHRAAALTARAREALRAVGLETRADAVAGSLSHGEQRQLEIAMVLATEPRVVLLDEPLAGIGPSETRAMVDLIRSLKHGRAILLVEHDMDAVFALADRLTVMADGRVIASGAPEAVRRDPAVRTAYLGVEPHLP